jgi:hypothetical protein
VGATVVSVVQWLNRRQPDNLAHRFLVGLKDGIENKANPMAAAINDELVRLKPAKWAMVWPVGGGTAAWLLRY